MAGTGVASPRSRAYLGRMAIFPRPVSPFRAIRDLRVYLAQRQRHELVFAFLSVAITTLILVGFYVDSKFERPWKRNIQYFENWPANRSDEEIRARLAADLIKDKERAAEIEKLRQERMKSFQRLDKKMDDLGI
jgi:hypothetical protein